MRGRRWLFLFVFAAAGACQKAGPMVYVSNERSGDVTVIDPKTDEVVRTIPLGSRARGIQLRDEKLYVALTNHGTKLKGAKSAIAEIDVAHGDRIRWLPSGTDPEVVAVRRDRNRAYVSNEDAGAASVLDIAGGKLLKTMVVGLEPEGVTLSPDERWCYVTGESSNSVTVIDTSKDEVVANVMVEGRPRAAAFSLDGSLAYVSCELGGSVCIVNTAPKTVRSCTRLGPAERPVGIVLSPDGRLVYVATGRGNTVVVLDGAGALVSRISVGQRPWGIARTADGSRLYVGNGLSNNVSVIDTPTRRVIRTIRAGDGPWGVAIGE
jgi:YVTN family beta-propeller protein